MKDRMNGFTLLELMLTLVIVSILVVLVAPGFSASIARGQLVSSSNQLLGLLQAARSEAITRNVKVQVCPLNGATASATCQSGLGTGGEIGILAPDPNSPNTLTVVQRISFSGKITPVNAASLPTFNFRRNGWAKNTAELPSWTLKNTVGDCTEISLSLVGQPSAKNITCPN